MRPSSEQQLAAKSGPSPDHLIGAQQDRFGDRNAEGFGGFEIDYEFELRRLLDRQVAWLNISY